MSILQREPHAQRTARRDGRAEEVIAFTICWGALLALVLACWIPRREEPQ